jgi:hypothetical protein
MPFLKITATVREVVNENRTGLIVTNDTTQIHQMAHDWCVPSAGRLSSFTENLNNSLVLKLISVVRLVFSGIIFVVVCWFRLQLARQAKRLKQSLYQVKRGLLSDYLREQLRSPSVVFA